MKMNTSADAGKTNPIQTQSNPTCSELVEPIFNPKNAPRLCNVFPFDRADITITGPIKYKKRKIDDADWIRTDKLACRRFGGQR
jgi:hypothetical protein